jgi:hypothetical protein
MDNITNLKSHMTVNLKRFMIRSIFAFFPGLSRKRTWAIIDVSMNDRRNEEEIEFVGKKTPRKRKNEASVIRATIHEHRAVLGLVNPTEKVTDTKKTLSPHPALFRPPEPRARTQARYGAACGRKSRVGGTEGFPTWEALRRRSVVQHKVMFHEYRFQRPLRYYEGYVSGVLYQQQGVYRPKPGNLLEK